jgi:hypothetical protein
MLRSDLLIGSEPATRTDLSPNLLRASRRFGQATIMGQLEQLVVTGRHLTTSNAKPFKYSVSGMAGITGWSGDWL